MTLARLALRTLGRNRLRVALTVVAAAVGVLAFVFLQTVIDLWYAGVAGAQADRLVVRNKTSITQPLPLSYVGRLAAQPGVSAVTYAGWFGGMLGESRRDFFANFYVDPSTYLQVFDEFLVPPEQLAAFQSDPCGAVIGRRLAERYGWGVGERITLNGTVFPGEWTFTVRGIYDGKLPSTDTTAMAFGYRCVNERAPRDAKDTVGYFAVRVDDPSRSGGVAAAIDSMFANSAFQTQTESERAFQLGFVAMSSAILAAVRIVSFVILAIILLVVGNTLAMGVRERTVDLATLRALGFRRRHVVGLVLAESAVLSLLSAALGIAAAPVVISGFVEAVSAAFGPMPEVFLAPATLALGVAAALVVGLAAGALPAARAARLPVADALRRVA